MSGNDELEGHLADRLGEVRDIANFARTRPLGTPEGQEVVGREIVVEGAEHLGGRKVRDTFTRGGKAAPVVIAPEDLPPAARKLEHHLKARLAEVHDEYPSSGGSIEAQLAKMRDLRKQMGGGKGP